MKISSAILLATFSLLLVAMVYTNVLLKKEYDKKQKEAEDLKKELDKPVDSTKYRYQKSTSYNGVPDAKKVHEAAKANEADENSSSVDYSRMAFMQMVL